jgi:hypothetical protein
VSTSNRFRNRVAALLPRRSRWRTRTRALGPRWRGFVADAVAAEDRFHAAVRRVDKGPLRDRLTDIGADVATAVDETWRVAAAGQDLSDARDAIDVGEILAELQRAGTTGAGADARRRQLDIAKRIDQRLAATERQLTDLDARLDEIVTQTLELGATQQLEILSLIGSAVGDVVEELHALSAGLAELPPTPTDAAVPPLRPGPPPIAPTPAPTPPESSVPAPPPSRPPYEGPMPDDPLPDPLMTSGSEGADEGTDPDDRHMPPGDLP